MSELGFNPTAEPLLEVRGLQMVFESRTGFLGRGRDLVRAVDGVDLELRAGETMGVVGESGSGKSTLARCILRLLDFTAGTIRVGGVDLASLDGSDLRRFRRHMQIVFQDPFGSLNPRLTVGAALEEPLRVHQIGTSAERRARVLELLDIVGLTASHAARYPHEFSGGQRQRIGIARALALSPELLIADEPVSALDVSVQAQVLNLLKDLRQELGLTMLFISHDLAVIEHVSDRVVVMRSGKVVESGTVSEVIANPQEAYTQELLAAVPSRDQAR